MPSRLSRGVWLLAALALALHLAVNFATPYEFHRDEFLYFAMGRHLQLWRMDFPPFIAILARTVRSTLGDSLPALRLAPALGGTALLLLTAACARTLGGGRGAQLLTVLAVFANPLFLRTASLFHPVVFDQLWWTLAFYGLLRIGQADEPRWWVLLGAAGGLGLLTKFSIGVPAVGIGLALVTSRHRGALATRWPWVGLAIALLIGSPSIVGQIRLDWPVLGQMSDLRTSQFVHVTVADFLAHQLLYGPATFLGLVGVIALLRRHDLAWARPVGVATLASFLLVLVLGGKAYYVGPVYPVLCAAGAVTLERWSVPAARPVRWGLAALLTLYGVGILPVGVPLLPPEPMSRYAQWVFGGETLKTNWGGVERLPQDYADMLGWRAQVDTVARVFRSLSPEDQRDAVIVGDNYGRAGALDFYGPRVGLPAPISTAGSFWFFGPGLKPGRVVIVVGDDREDLEKFFGDIQPAARFTHPWMVSEERDVTIWVCRQPRGTLQEAWPSLQVPR